MGLLDKVVPSQKKTRGSTNTSRVRIHNEKDEECNICRR